MFNFIRFLDCVLVGNMSCLICEFVFVKRCRLLLMLVCPTLSFVNCLLRKLFKNMVQHLRKKNKSMNN